MSQLKGQTLQNESAKRPNIAGFTNFFSHVSIAASCATYILGTTALSHRYISLLKTARFILIFERSLKLFDVRLFLCWQLLWKKIAGIVWLNSRRITKVVCVFKFITWYKWTHAHAMSILSCKRQIEDRKKNVSDLRPYRRTFFSFFRFSINVRTCVYLHTTIF